VLVCPTQPCQGKRPFAYHGSVTHFWELQRSELIYGGLHDSVVQLLVAVAARIIATTGLLSDANMHVARAPSSHMDL
jgi:hypothetical protein